MVLSILVLWQRRWWQQLRHSALMVAAPSCSKGSGNVVVASAGGRLTLAAARARSGDASRSCSAAYDRLRRWRQQLRHSALVVAAPSCTECSGNVVAASAGGRLALAAARARSRDAS